MDILYTHTHKQLEEVDIKIDIYLKDVSTMESQGPEDFIVKSYKIHKEERISFYTKSQGNLPEITFLSKW